MDFYACADYHLDQLANLFQVDFSPDMGSFDKIITLGHPILEVLGELYYCKMSANTADLDNLETSFTEQFNKIFSVTEEKPHLNHLTVVI